jgi:hypothetical protein
LETSAAISFIVVQAFRRRFRDTIGEVILPLAPKEPPDSTQSADTQVPLTSFEKGKLKIAAHVREELELARIPFESIHCKSGSLHIPPGVVRLTVTVDSYPSYVDLTTPQVEDCELLVAGESWHRIAAFIEGLKKR